MARQPKTIKQRLEIDGGQKLRDELAELGKQGEKAFDLIKKAAASGEGPLARFGRSVETLRRRAAALRAQAAVVGQSFQRLGRNLANVRSGLATTTRRVALLTGAAVGAAAAVFAFAQASAQAADDQAKAAEGLGLSIEEYGRYQFAAEQSGIETVKFANGLARLNQAFGEALKASRDTGRSVAKETRSLAEQFAQNATGARALGAAGEEAAAGGSLMTQALRKLGVSLFDEQGRLVDFNEFLGRVADGFQKLPDGPEKTAIAVDLLGTRLAIKFLPFLNQGRAGIAALGREGEKAGLIFTELQGRIGTRFVDSLNLLKRTVLALRNQIGLIFAPEFTAQFQRLTDFLVENSQEIKAAAERNIRDAVRVIEDLVAAVEGRDADVRNGFILEARDAVVGFARDVQAAYQTIFKPAFLGLIDLLDSAAAVVNVLFGTRFTGRQIGIAVALGQILGILPLLTALFGSLATAVIAFAASFTLLAPLGALIGGLFDTIVAGAALAVGAITGVAAAPPLAVAAFAAAVAAIVIYWDEIVAAARAAFDAIPGLAQAASDDLRGVWNGLGEFFTGLLDGVVAAFESVWDGIVARARAAFDSLLSLWRRLQSLIASTQGSAGAASAIAGGGAGVPVLAKGGLLPAFAGGGGGPLQGPGTATSDSILARLSRGEFVVQAKAVAYYGADLLRALNALRLPRGGFALGGLVSGLERSLGSLAPRPAIPALAAGGLVAATAAPSPDGQAINLFLDGRRFPVTARPEVAKELTREVLAQQRSSAGKLPSWFGS